MTLASILGYCLIGAFPIFQFGCYGMLQHKKDNIAIRKRNVTMVYVSTIAAWLAYVNLVNSLFGGLPCVIHHIFAIVIPPLSVGTQLLRGIKLWGMLKRHKILSQSYGDFISSNTNSLTGGAEINRGPLTVIHEVDSSKGEHSHISDIYIHVRKKSDIDEQVINIKIEVMRTIGLARLLLIVLPMTLILALLVLTDPEQLGETNFQQCFPEPPLILNGGRVLAGILSLTAFGTTIFMNNCHDGLGIRIEIIRNIAILFFTNIIGFVFRYMDLMQWHALINVVQQMMLSFSMTVLPCLNDGVSLMTWMKSTSKKLIPGYARPLPQMPSPRGSLLLTGKKMSQIDLRENSKRIREATMSLDAGLCILLSSNDGIEAFTEHCSREFSVENVKFWLEVNEFHKAADNVKDMKEDNCYSQKDLWTFAQEIFNTFIEEGSNMQINISEAQVISIRQKIASEEAITRDAFDNAQREIYSLMSRHSYPRFLSSKSAVSYKSKVASKKMNGDKRFGKRNNSTVLPA